MGTNYRSWLSGLMLATSLLPAYPSMAFNPNADADTPSLPNPSAIYSIPENRYNTNRDGYIPPVSAIEMPKPLYPDRIQSTAITNPLAAALPPVSPEVQAKAQALLADPSTQQQTKNFPIALPTTAATATTSGFIAPPPLLATAPNPLPVPVKSPIPLISKAPEAAVAQAAQEVVGVSAHHPSELSDQTRTILSHVPGNIDKAQPSKAGAVAISRVSPEVKDLLGAKAKEDSYETVGLSIKVRRPGLDANYELNRAYTSLMGGDTTEAIETYKNILSTESTNQDALFGLAATYHRLGNLDKARPLYGALLKINPQHREGLNNFLVLVSDESPQDALPELVRLESRNPNFSPIPAQIAIVLDKLGFKSEAREKMLRAIELAPDNMTYKYNLAIMLDHQGQVADAAALYRMLIESSLRGEKVPASADAMQRRLNYLSASSTTIPTPKLAAVIN